MGDLSNLQRSVSHLNWGSYLGFDEAGHYAIETVEGRRLAFDATSGRLVAVRTPGLCAPITKIMPSVGCGRGCGRG